MVQPVNYPLIFTGPFLGLNTEQSPYKMSGAFARNAENVILTPTGSARPREPLTPYISKDALARDQKIPGVAVGMIHLDLESLAVGGGTPNTDKAAVLVKTVPNSGDLELVTRAGVDSLDTVWEVSDSPTTFQPTWVLANGWLYVIDGASPLVKYNGDVVRTVGIEPPTNSNNFILIDDPEHPDWPDPPPTTANVRYAVTFYDSTIGVESNPRYYPAMPHLPNVYLSVGADQTYKIAYKGPAPDPPFAPPPQGRGIDTIRIYRQNVSLSQPYFRLVAELDASEAGYWVDAIQVNEEEEEPIESPVLSDTATGPFAPVRNVMPPKSRVAAWYKRRMYYSDPDDGSLLWYSELDYPEYVSDTSYFPIGGDPDDVITGMVEMAGQLVVLKKKSIWIVSGDFDQGDNTSDALGEPRGEDAPEIYKSKSKTGCDCTVGGNGAIVCGHPPLLYYSNSKGLYRFDGVDDRPVSDLIFTEWYEMLDEIAASSSRPYNHSISYANAVEDQLLLVCPSASAMAYFPQRVLAYQWGINRGDSVGGWTRLRFDELGVGDEQCLGIGCVASALGKVDHLGYQDVWGRAPYLVALIYEDTSLNTRVFMADPEPDEVYDPVCYVPSWKWETGELCLADRTRQHLYWLKCFHDRHLLGPTTPKMKVSYSVDGGDYTLIGPEIGMDISGPVLRRRLGRNARSISLRFERGDPTQWARWGGLTGFALDSELAEQR